MGGWGEPSSVSTRGPMSLPGYAQPARRPQFVSQLRYALPGIVELRAPTLARLNFPQLLQGHRKLALKLLNFGIAIELHAARTHTLRSRGASALLAGAGGQG